MKSTFLLFQIPFIVFLVSANSFAADSNSYNDYIVGGTPVTITDPIASSTVALVMIDPTQEVSLCSGSILTDEMIITAAHCVAHPKSVVRIVFGTKFTSDDLKNSVQADSFEPHPDYNPAKMSQDQNDVGLVFFRGGLPEGYKPAVLLTQANTLAKGTEVELAGYGITQAGTQKGAGVLRKAQVEVVNPNFGKTEVILDQSHGEGACHGDSGGPAFVRNGATNYLWGITSRAYPNTASDDCAHQVVYTKIASQIGFIESAMKKSK
jgi:secreted trypsin-like serine protease